MLTARGHPPLSEELSAWESDHREIADNGASAARDAARSMIQQHAAQLAASPAPIVLEGVDPPWLLLELAEATPRSPTGYQPGIRVVQADAAEFFSGCARANLTPLLADTRIEWFIGTDAGQRLRLAMDAETDQLSQSVITVPTIGTRVRPDVATICQQAATRQQQRHIAHSERAKLRDTDIPNRQRLKRLTSSDADEPRRVALIASRFTAVLRPQIEDLAEAFRRAGWQTRLISETDDHRRLAPNAYSEVFDVFDPDLIIATNYTRQDIVTRVLGGTPLPCGVPWVTWIQDAMPHLLGPRVGSSLGPLDFAIGHISRTMTETRGFSREQVLTAPMFTSDTKFTPPIEAHECDRCEVAAFTNHSETPESMRNRLIQESSNTPQLHAVVADLASAALELAERPYNTFHAGYEARRVVQNVIPTAKASTVENLAITVVRPLIDRVQRHRVLGWAREICQRRGWTMRVHGKGWLEHPTLADVAAGELAHGEPLARAYHGAGLTLHVSSTAIMHQRLIECAFAGGLPCAGATYASVRFAQSRIIKRLLADHAHLGRPAIRPQGPGLPAEPVRVFDRAVSPLADRNGALSTLIGWPDEQTTAVPDIDPASCKDSADEADLDAMIGLVELGFSDSAGLEALIERANADPAWRAEHSRRIADRARKSCTHASLVRRIESAYASLSATGRASA
ncbi:MAG: hypothetical protein AAGB48_04580 [Planctomycetota bacterium]